MSVIARSLEVSRSNLYEHLHVQDSEPEKCQNRESSRKADEQIVQQIRTILETRPTYGYRRITAILRRRGEKSINHKKVYRIMKDANLLLQKHTGKVQRTPEG